MKVAVSFFVAQKKQYELTVFNDELLRISGVISELPL